MFRSKEKKSINYYWYLGDTQKLREYHNLFENESTGMNFYASEDIKTIRVVHSGLPAIISNTITGLVGVNDIDIDTEKETDKELIDEFYNDNEILSKLQDSIKNLTWSGECFIKFNRYYSEDEPVIDAEVVNPLNAKVYYYRGRVNKYEFIIWESEDKTERTIEEYGKGYIEVRQEKLSSEENSDNPDFWHILSLSKTVFSTNEIFAIHAEVPEDAYTKSLQIFDALDETYSRMPQEAREGQMVKLMDSRLVPINEKGERIKDTKAGLKTFTMIEGFRTEDGEPLVKHLMADIDPDKRYLKSKEQYTKDAIRNAGLSFHTYAGGEVKGNISAESQRELEKISIRTRKEYIGCLNNFIKRIFEIFLFLKTVNITSQVLDTNNMNDTINIIDNDKEVTINFNDYIQNSIETRIKVWGSIEAKEIFPLKFRMQKILENELSEEEIDKLVAQFQKEEGSMVDDDEEQEI